MQNNKINQHPVQNNKINPNSRVQTCKALIRKGLCENIIDIRDPSVSEDRHLIGDLSGNEQV